MKILMSSMSSTCPWGAAEVNDFVVVRIGTLTKFARTPLSFVNL
jgi:hypothetical protein